MSQLQDKQKSHKSMKLTYYEENGWMDRDSDLKKGKNQSAVSTNSKHCEGLPNRYLNDIQFIIERQIILAGK